MTLKITSANRSPCPLNLNRAKLYAAIEVMKADTSEHSPEISTVLSSVLG